MIWMALKTQVGTRERESVKKENKKIKTVQGKEREADILRVCIKKESIAVTVIIKILRSLQF